MNDGISAILADKFLRKSILAVLLFLALFLAIEALSAARAFNYIGGGVPATNVVTINGTGEIFAVPDIAEFNFSLIERAETVMVAQENATKKSNDIIAYLKGAGIEERDIRTVGYNVYPRYEYEQRLCISYPCPPGPEKLVGFEVSHTITVKVRDTEKAGELLSEVGARGASNVSGLTFTIDDEDDLRRQARQEAIEDAREKADQLAKDLGVRLVRVVNFYESGEYPIPLYYDKAMGMGGEGAVSSVAPEIPTGENKIVSNVSITYEIR